MAFRQGLIFVALSAALLVTAPPAGASPRAARTTLRLINRSRAAHHVPLLRPDPRLRTAAARHSRDMVIHRYFSHRSRRGLRPSSRIARTGWMRGRRSWDVGEDLAWHISGASARWVVRAWLRSPPHRRVPLDPAYRVVGIGVARGTPVGAAGLTVTADFGS